GSGARPRSTRPVHGGPVRRVTPTPSRSNSIEATPLAALRATVRGPAIRPRKRVRKAICTPPALGVFGRPLSVAGAARTGGAEAAAEQEVEACQLDGLGEVRIEAGGARPCLVGRCAVAGQRHEEDARGAQAGAE